MKKLLLILRAIGSYISGGKYVSSFKAINGSIWWEDEDKSIIASFSEILSTTAIGVINQHSAKIYFPYNIFKVKDGETVKYIANIKLYTIMKPEELDGWVTEINNYPFI